MDSITRRESRSYAMMDAINIRHACRGAIAFRDAKIITGNPAACRRLPGNAVAARHGNLSCDASCALIPLARAGARVPSKGE